MAAPDLEALETLITDRLMAIMNPLFVPAEPAIREVFNMVDKPGLGDDTPRRLPCVGLLHEDEPWEDDEVLGVSVSKIGREQWYLLLLCDAPTRGGGMRGKRGAYKLSGLIMDDLEGWQIIAGNPVKVERRVRFEPRNDNGELSPFSGYVIPISFPVDFQN
jgi:hypothetical protein